MKKNDARFFVQLPLSWDKNDHPLLFDSNHICNFGKSLNST